MISEDARYLKGIEHFNKKEFYDAHEVWEDLWHTLQGQEAQFVQGLIQFATALHHFEAQNLKGAKILSEGGQELLAGIPDEYENIRLKDLKDGIDLCFKELKPKRVEQLPSRFDPNKHSFPIQINKDLIPIIKFKESYGGA